MTYKTIDEWTGYRLREMTDQGVVIERWVEFQDIMDDNNWREVEDTEQAYFVLRDRLAQIMTNPATIKVNTLCKVELTEEGKRVRGWRMKHPERCFLQEVYEMHSHFFPNCFKDNEIQIDPKEIKWR